MLESAFSAADQTLGGIVSQSRMGPARGALAWASASALCAVLLALTGCRQVPELNVTICGDVHIPGDIDAIRVELLDEERTVLQSGIDELFIAAPDAGLSPLDAGPDAVDAGPACPAGERTALPYTTTLAGHTGPVWVRAQGLADSAIVLTAERRLTLEDTSTTLSIAFDRQCMHVRCPLGQTCHAGDCRRIDQLPAEPECPFTTRAPEGDAGPAEEDPCAE